MSNVPILREATKKILFKIQLNSLKSLVLLLLFIIVIIYYYCYYYYLFI